MTSDAAILREALRAVAPGTPLREGLERIQRSHTGALIVLGYTPEVQAICSGGFDLDIAFTAARLRELCKMDGAVIIDPDLWRIRKANVQLFPDPTIPTDESGMRHRTAQRTARQTHLPVLSLSASMRMISIYVGTEHRLVEEPEALLSRANLAVDTLDRYSQRLDEVLQTLTILEMRDSATVRDVATVMQRMEMIRRITSEITEYLEELGSEGRLLALQVEDLVRGSASERALVMRDYIRDPDDVARVEAELSSLGSERIVDLTAIANILGLDVYEVADLDREITPRGVRALSLVPHLSWNAIKAVSAHFTTLPQLRAASVADIEVIDGVGHYRAQLIVENLAHQAQAVGAGVVGVEDGGPVRPQAGDDLRLGRGDSLDGAEAAHVGVADHEDSGRVQGGDVGEVGDVARSGGSHLQDEVAGGLVGLQHGQRQTDLIVEAGPGRHRGAGGGQELAGEVLGVLVDGGVEAVEFVVEVLRWFASPWG